MGGRVIIRLEGIGPVGVKIERAVRAGVARQPQRHHGPDAKIIHRMLGPARPARFLAQVLADHRFAAVHRFQAGALDELILQGIAAAYQIIGACGRSDAAAMQDRDARMIATSDELYSKINSDVQLLDLIRRRSASLDSTS